MQSCNLNRLVTIDYPDSTDVNYEYGGPDETDRDANLAGRIKQVTDESGTEERWHGRLGEMGNSLAIFFFGNYRLQNAVQTEA
jgi:hypothetical protein